MTTRAAARKLQEPGHIQSIIADDSVKNDTIKDGTVEDVTMTASHGSQHGPGIQDGRGYHKGHGIQHALATQGTRLAQTGWNRSRVGAMSPSNRGASIANGSRESLPAVSRKRKRGAVASSQQAVWQPVGNGWDMLPHGMGVAPDGKGAKTTSSPEKQAPGRQSRFTMTRSQKDDSDDYDRRRPHTKTSDDDVDKSGIGKDPEDVRKRQRMPATKASVSASRGVSTEEGTAAEVEEQDDQGHPVVRHSIALDPEFRVRVKRGRLNRYGLTPGYSPYPHRTVPSFEACEEVYRLLANVHGDVTQPLRAPEPSLVVAGCGEVPSVLDALLRTLISGNTMMARADEAVRNLVERYGTVSVGVGAGSVDWNEVRTSSMEDLVLALRPAGCAKVKGRQIMAILNMVHEERSEEQVSLDHVHGYTKAEAMAEFLRYPGIGVKTAACVVLFCLRIPCFAVDTHVHKFCQWLGWVPARATELDSFNHGEAMVPDHLKYGLHQLFIRHGQQCFRCRRATQPGSKEWEEAECPLEHLLDRRGGKPGPGKGPGREA